MIAALGRHSFRAAVVAGSDDDACRIEEALSACRIDAVAERVASLAALEARLGPGSWDVVLCAAEAALPSVELTLAALRRHDPDLPFVLFTEDMAAEQAADLVAAGVSNVVFWRNVGRLRTVLVREMEGARQRRGRAHLEQRLRESEARFRDFAEAGSDWQWEMDADYRFTWFSSRVTEVTGVGTTELLGRRRWEGLAIDFARDENWRRHREDLLAHRPFRNFRYDFVGSDGRRRHLRVSGNPVFGARGEFIGYRGSANDETAVVEAQQLVKQAEGRLLEALDAISEGFVLFDGDDRLVLCNAKYRRMNAPVADMIVPGIRFEDLVRRELELGHYVEAVGREEEWLAARMFMHRAPTATFERQLMDGRWSLVRERRTRNGGSVGIRVDITVLKQREQELLQAKEAAEVANRAKSEFLSNMSHELRTPLNAIIGFSEIMRTGLLGPIGNKSYAEYVSAIHESGTHLLSLIGDILDLSKIEAGRLNLADEEVDVADVIRGTSSILEERARSSQLRLNLDLPLGLPRLRGEARALRQILLNLLSNAIKFTPPGGSVAVGAHREVGELVIFVKDTGIGIAPTDLSRVMEPFGQVESSLVRRHQGTGLGLPLAKKLVEAHGGILTVESALKVGTVVTARFPAARLIAPRAAATG